MVVVPVSIRSNSVSLSAQRKLASTTADLSRTYERLSSGMRINRASDDAAGLAVASTLNAERRILGTALRNISDGLSISAVMSGALDQQTSILGRLGELAEQSANGTLSSAQRTTLQAEYAELIEEMGRIGETTVFNGLELLRGDRGNMRGGLAIQAGLRGDVNSRVTMQGLDVSSLSGVIDRNSLTISTAKIETALAGGTEAELRERLGDNVVFLDGSQSSDGNRKALILFRSDVDDTIGVFALDFTSSTGKYSTDFFTYLDMVGFQSAGGGQIQYDSSSGRVLSQSALSFNIEGNDFTTTFDFSGYKFLSNPQGGATALDFTNLISASNARSALDVIRNKVSELGTYRGLLGATESRLSTAFSLASQSRETRAAAESRILDADIGAESSELIRRQILQQASISVLAQANQAPALALQLLR